MRNTPSAFSPPLITTPTVIISPTSKSKLSGIANASSASNHAPRKELLDDTPSSIGHSHSGHTPSVTPRRLYPQMGHGAS